MYIFPIDGKLIQKSNNHKKYVHNFFKASNLLNHNMLLTEYWHRQILIFSGWLLYYFCTSKPALKHYLWPRKKEIVIDREAITTYCRAIIIYARLTSSYGYLCLIDRMSLSILTILLISRGEEHLHITSLYLLSLLVHIASSISRTTGECCVSMH